MSNSKPTSKPTTPDVAARIQRAVAKQNGGQIPQGNYVTRIQRAATKSQTSDGGNAK